MPNENKYISPSAVNLNCIWESSNFITKFLCNANFNCENCALDKILRNLEQYSAQGSLSFNGTGFLDDLIERVKKYQPEANLIYLKNHLTLKHLFVNIFYLGIDPIFLILLDSLDGIDHFMKRIYYTKGQKIITLNGKWGNITLELPLNLLVLDKLNWTVRDVLEKKWIALVLVNDNEIADARISCERWKKNIEKTADVLNVYREYSSNISPLAFTGGEEIKYLHQLIGKHEYLKLLGEAAED